MSEGVLIVQPGFLGDAVLATGMLRALHGADPAMPFGMLVRSEYAPILAGHPALRHLHGVDKKRGEDVRRVTEEIRSCQYNLALIPHRSIRSQLFPFRAGIPRRIGFRQSAFSFLCTDRVEYDIAEHELRRNAALVVRAGFGVAEESIRSWLQPDPALAESFSKRFASEGAPILVAPGSVWPTKCWPEEHFAGLCRSLLEQEERVLLVGSGGERELCLRIGRSAGMPEENILAGQLRLPELVALAATARRVVTNDSAPLHIAEGVGTPVSAVFGPTVPEFGFSPYHPDSSVMETHLSCRPCGIHGHRSCPIGTHECMRSISVERVLDSIMPSSKRTNLQ